MDATSQMKQIPNFFRIKIKETHKSSSNELLLVNCIPLSTEKVIDWKAQILPKFHEFS